MTGPFKRNTFSTNPLRPGNRMVHTLACRIRELEDGLSKIRSHLVRDDLLDEDTETFIDTILSRKRR